MNNTIIKVIIFQKIILKGNIRNKRRKIRKVFILNDRHLLFVYIFVLYFIRNLSLFFILLKLKLLNLLL
jgi:hypothetical protein